MELIKKLQPTENEKGTLQSWGLFLCPFCLEKVERFLWNGYKAKSCGCKKSEFSANANRGKKLTQEHKDKISLGNKGKKRNEVQKKNYSEAQKGHIVTEMTRQKLSIKNTGELSPAWKNGVSFEPYSPEFNKPLKQQVLERDNYICQNSNCNHLSERLDVHHIDYNKKNNNPENLIVLCKSCHTKTNFNRQYWTEFYQNTMINKI